MTALARQVSQDIGSGLWSADQFLEFHMTRPDEERWQLLDGLAMMMTPPTVRHQMLAKNVLRLIDRALDVNRPDLVCLYEMGLRIPDIEDFNPEPDLLVLARSDDFDRYVDRFFLVAEVISPSNTAEMIERKLELYQRHPDNLYCLTIDQDSVHVALYARHDNWKRTDFRSLDDVLRLLAFGFEATLSEVYKGTPLG